ncbi:hypothetical protein J6590_047308 [Homalodisca vitripennis]|nr:hypothetical protein J6590_047308 [Homalodisca vitripennis]
MTLYTVIKLPTNNVALNSYAITLGNVHNNTTFLAEINLHVTFDLSLKSIVISLQADCNPIWQSALYIICNIFYFVKTLLKRYRAAVMVTLSVSTDCRVRNGHGVGISLRRQHNEEPSSLEPANRPRNINGVRRGVAPGVDIGTLRDYCLEDVSTAGREENKTSQGEEIRQTRRRGKTTCWMIDANHASTSREKESPAP